MADGLARVGGGTPAYEAFLERKRQALRKALRTEFIRQRYHPNLQPDGVGHLFDAAIQRWQAMQATQGEFFYPTLKNFTYFAGLIIIPTTAFIYFSNKIRIDFEAECRNGTMAYDDVRRRGRWFLN